MNKKILLFIGGFFAAHPIYADNAAIVNANNQAFIDGQLGNDRLSYSRNHPADAGAPLYNASGSILGAEVGVSKTFGHIYSQFALGINRTLVNYSDSSLDNTPFSNGNAVTLSVDGRLGYSFFPHDNTAFTPYLYGGYAQNQLNTGGYSASFLAANYGGATFITQTFYYGIGILNQWAATPKWVLNLDAQLGTQYHPWVNGNVNNFNNQASATTTYQQWSLSPEMLWQLGIGSDYSFEPNWHFRANIAYGRFNIGQVNSAADGIFPSQYHAYWLGTLGLGRSFTDSNTDVNNNSSGNQETIHAANNQASLHAGFETPSFQGGTTAFQYNQSGSLPALGLVFDKTWQAVYTEIAASEAFGTISSSNNTTYDIAGKLGYQFASSISTSITPYATLGYHRASQAVQGTPSNAGAINGIPQTYFINGVTETYQHNWYGVGLLLQLAALPKLVLSADGNIGRTFNASMQSWMPLGLPINTSYSLGNAYYQMIGLGADYLLKKNWHLQANMGYWNTTYNPSSTNAFDIAAVTDHVHQFNFTLGLGYSFA